jgi:transposase
MTSWRTDATASMTAHGALSVARVGAPLPIRHKRPDYAALAVVLIVGFAALGAYFYSQAGKKVPVVVVRARQLTRQINSLEAELRPLIRALAPSLLAIPGCGVLGAAMIVGETAGAHRFRNKDAYARFTGTAPIPVWSGASKGKVRLNRGGNRTINTALHMIAVTQSRGHGPGKAYLDKLAAAGKTRTEAIRLLRRRLSDVAFTTLRVDEQAPASEPNQPDPAALPAAA